MPFEPTKVIEMNRGKQIGQTSIQDAENIPYGSTNVKDALDQINTDLTKFMKYPNLSATPLHEFTAGDSWTATQDCMLIGAFRHISTGSPWIKVDDVVVANCSGSNTYTSCANIQLCIKAGSVVTTSTNFSAVGADMPSVRAFPLI